MSKYIMALDQGTTSSRCILFNRKGEIQSIAQKEFGQIYPRPGWVEHNPMEIWSSQMAVTMEAMAQVGADASDIAGIGITNQRETTILWDKITGEPVYNAIVWQCRRTAQKVDELVAAGYGQMIREKTGLVPDAYFSATKIAWILDHVPEARSRAENGEILFGTVDSWLIWNMTKGEIHVTDYTNASRTMLMNLHQQTWDEELLELFHIPASVLPKIISSDSYIADTASGLLGANIPITGILGDQQSALFGQSCFEVGSAKNTYGTGCFMLFNTGQDIQLSQNKLLSTLAWQAQGQTTYALEGSVFMAGAVVQWLRDGLGIIQQSRDVEKLACKVEDTDGVVLVPAFTGLGAPHWDSEARALLCGMSRGTTQAHIARAALESIAFQVSDVLSAMQSDIAHPLKELRVDGGASSNDMLMQFQADILNVPVLRPKMLESTAWGAAAMAGLKAGVFSNLEEISQSWQLEHAFEPKMQNDEREAHLAKWQKALNRAKSDL